MNENEVFRFKVRIAIPNLSRENKDMINSILDGINKKDEEEKGYLYTVRVKLNNGKVVHATLFSKDKKGPTFDGRLPHAIHRRPGRRYKGSRVVEGRVGGADGGGGAVPNRILLGHDIRQTYFRWISDYERNGWRLGW